MIEGRSGGSGRGTRRELWAPPDSGSAQPTDRRFVSCTDSRPEPFPAPPTHFLPSAASSPVAPACWPQGKIPPHPSARSARHSSPQHGGPKSVPACGRRRLKNSAADEITMLRVLERRRELQG